MPLDQAQWQIDILAADKTAAAFASVGRRMRDMERAFTAGARQQASQVQAIVDSVVRSATDPTAIVKQQAAGFAALAASQTLLGKVNAQAMQQFGALRVQTDGGAKSLTAFNAAATAAASGGGGGGALLGMLGRLVPAISAGAAAWMVWNAGMKAGALIDQAEQVGLTVDQLQAYRFAALQVGVSNEQLDSSVLSLTKAMGAANGGSDEMIAKFGKLGVKLLDSRGELRSVASVMPEVARGLLSISSETERSAMSQEIFGKSGARMLTLLNEMAKGSDALVESARQQRVVVGVDVAEAWNKLDSQLKITKETAEVALAALGAPIATWALERVDAILKDILGNLDRLKKIEMKAPQIATGADIKVLEDQLAAQKQLLAINPNNKMAQSSVAALEKRIAWERSVLTQLEAATDMETLNRGKLPVVEPAAGTLGTGQPVGKQAAGGAANAAESLAKKKLEESKKLLDQMLDDIEKIRKAGEAMTDRFGDGMAKAARETAALNEMLQLGYIDVDTYAAALRGINQAADDQSRAFIGAKGGFDAYIAGFDQAVADLSRANTEFEIGKKAIDLLTESVDILAGVSNKSFSQIAIDFAIMVAKMEAARAASQLWTSIGGLSGIGGLISSAFTAIVGGVTAGTGAGGVMDGSYGGSLTYGGPRAAGGAVNPGSWYMVGERGPEPFVPNSAGRIYPSGSMGGGSPIIINQKVYIGEHVTTTEFHRGLAAVKQQSIDGAQEALLARRRFADPSVKGVF